jgi:hypothetical protein
VRKGHGVDERDTNTSWASLRMWAENSAHRYHSASRHASDIGSYYVFWSYRLLRTRKIQLGLVLWLFKMRVMHVKLARVSTKVGMKAWEGGYIATIKAVMADENEYWKEKNLACTHFNLNRFVIFSMLFLRWGILKFSYVYPQRFSLSAYIFTPTLPMQITPCRSRAQLQGLGWAQLYFIVHAICSSLG